MGSENTRMLLHGNHAVAFGVRLACPQVIPVYPITPQTPILEKLIEFQHQGQMSAEFMAVESEHSAMAACIAASLAGARTFTATASQGLLLMHELLHYASGARAPIVLVNVNRTIASPWAFWPDQTDSLSQRDTGWIQYYSESGQESLDTVLEAYWTAEKAGLPAMVSHEAFYVSHAMEIVDVPDQAIATAFLPPYRPECRLDPALGLSWGNVVSQDMYYRHRVELDEAMVRALAAAEEADARWRELTGRGYGVIEQDGLEGADLAIAVLGSMSANAREAVAQLRRKGLKAGLLRVRLFRPFPIDAVRKAMVGVPKVMVLDRNFAPGTGGILYQELRSALYGFHPTPELHGFLVGVGGVSVSPARIVELAEDTLCGVPEIRSQWRR